MVKLFGYKKNNERYWDRAKLHKQVVGKALPIIETSYLDYWLLSLFDNTISHFVYANNTLHIRKMNRSFGSKQVWLCYS